MKIGWLLKLPPLISPLRHFWFCENTFRVFKSPSFVNFHYNDVIMGAMASQITSLTIYSTVHQSSASLAFLRGIHRWPVNSPRKWPVTRKMSPLGIFWYCRCKFFFWYQGMYKWIHSIIFCATYWFNSQCSTRNHSEISTVPLIPLYQVMTLTWFQLRAMTVSKSKSWNAHQKICVKYFIKYNFFRQPVVHSLNVSIYYIKRHQHETITEGIHHFMHFIRKCQWVKKPGDYSDCNMIGLA